MYLHIHTMYACVYIYVSIYIYIYIYTATYIRTPVTQSYFYTHLWSCLLLKFTYLCINVLIYLFIRTHACTWICSFLSSSAIIRKACVLIFHPLYALTLQPKRSPSTPNSPCSDTFS